VPEEQVLNALRMVATLGHGCGLVDPLGRMPGQPSPIYPLLRLVESAHPSLTRTWEFRKAVERAGGLLPGEPSEEELVAEAGRLQGEYGEEAPSV
jgi:hypothetical protein